MAKEKTRSQAIEECDLAHGSYVKDRDCPDGYCYCISCRKSIKRNECEAGHYIIRKHMATRWDDRNVNAQCWICNNDLKGNIPGYTIGLINKYGEGIVDELIALSKQEVHFSTREILEKIKIIKQSHKAL